MKSRKHCLRKSQLPTKPRVDKEEKGKCLASVRVRWPNGEIEVVKSVRLFLQDLAEPIVLDNATVFIGLGSFTVKSATLTTLYPFTVIRKIELEQ